jgi:WD40 repeat protein
VRIFDVRNSKVVGKLRGHIDDRTPTSIEFCASEEDSQRPLEIIVMSDDGCVKCWDFCNGHELWSLNACPNGLGKVAISNDGNTLATASVPGRMLKIWRRK